MVGGGDVGICCKVLLLSLQVGANKGKVVKFDSGWLVRMGSEFSVVILRNLTRGEFSVGTKLPRECNFEKTQRIQKFPGSAALLN